MKEAFIIALLFAGSCSAAAQKALAADETIFDRVHDKARNLAAKPYVPPNPGALPEALRKLDYSRYRDIRFDRKHALWREDALFNVEMFHLGFLYKEPVILHEVENGVARTVDYNPALFDLGKNEGLGDKLSPNLGFAGFRVHFPLNRGDYKDEVVAFLGASYFRMVGRNQLYGLSARGLAVDTASPEGEEFPRFREFWLVKPGPEDTTLTFYALLDSPSLTGAYEFRLTPGADVVLSVKSRLFPRKDINLVGVAPLTSMFLFGENGRHRYDDFRSEVHDSDGLMMLTGAGEWIWRPLTNGHSLRVSSLMDTNVQGFGLVQRDRVFDNYLDLESHFERRPSLWIRPTGDGWGKGAVRLIEIPTDSETNDNIVAFWVPSKPFKAGETYSFDYDIETFGSNLSRHDITYVKRTAIGWGANPGAAHKPPRSVRQFAIDFVGGILNTLDPSQPVKPQLSNLRGMIKDVTVQPLPNKEGWRVAFKLYPEKGNPADMRLFLTLYGRRISETWSYLWQPGDEK